MIYGQICTSASVLLISLVTSLLLTPIWAKLGSCRSLLMGSTTRTWRRDSQSNTSWFRLGIHRATLHASALDVRRSRECDSLRNELLGSLRRNDIRHVGPGVTHLPLLSWVRRLVRLRIRNRSAHDLKLFRQLIHERISATESLQAREILQSERANMCRIVGGLKRCMSTLSTNALIHIGTCVFGHVCHSSWIERMVGELVRERAVVFMKENVH